MGKWREELTAQEVSQIEWTVGQHMETFGYERAMDPPSSLTIARGLGFAMFDKVRLRYRQFPNIWHSLVQPTKLTKTGSSSKDYADTEDDAVNKPARKSVE